MSGSPGGAKKGGSLHGSLILGIWSQTESLVILLHTCQRLRLGVDLPHGGGDLVHVGARAQEHRLDEPDGLLAQLSRWPGSDFALRSERGPPGDRSGEIPWISAQSRNESGFPSRVMTTRHAGMQRIGWQDERTVIGW